MSSPIAASEIAKLLDHSLLHPTMTDDEIRRGLELGARYNVATCCVKPYSVELAARVLRGTGVGVCSVMAFPHGNQTVAMKLAEAQDGMGNGATELDMVINVGKAIGGDYDYVEDEVRQINEMVVAGGAKLKVIFENDFLNDEQIVRLCDICSRIEVGWVKTSTGYGFVKQLSGEYNYRGATLHHVRLMRQKTDQRVGVKAAGGVRTLSDVLAVRPWCTRIGASATAAIMEEAYKVERGEATVGESHLQGGY